MANPRVITTYLRRYLNDLSTADTSTHSVSFSVSIRSASLITYIRRYLNDITGTVEGAILTEGGVPITTEGGDTLVIET